MSTPNSSAAQPANNKKTNWTLILGTTAVILLFLAILFFVKNRSNAAALADTETELATVQGEKSDLDGKYNEAVSQLENQKGINSELGDKIDALNAQIKELKDTSVVAQLTAEVDSLEKVINNSADARKLAEANAKIAELEAKVAQLEEAASKNAGLTAKGDANGAKPKVEPLQTEPKIVETDMVGQPKKGEIWVSRTNKTVQVRKSMKSQVPEEFAGFATREWPR